MDEYLNEKKSSGRLQISENKSAGFELQESISEFYWANRSELSRPSASSNVVQRDS